MEENNSKFGAGLLEEWILEGYFRAVLESKFPD